MRILGVVSSSSREVPNAPTIGTATDVGTGRAYNNGAATVTFTAPTFDGGLPITGYTVTSSPGGFTGTGSASPITVTGLQSGTAYTFTVVATNSRGNSTASSASNSITATTVPQAPTVSVTDVGTGRAFNNGAATVTVTGGATGGKAISSYSAVSSPGSFSASGSSPLTVTGLASNTSYTYSVTATNANGTSTATVSGAVTATTVPQAPTIGTATAGNAQATVTFTGNATGGKAISTYTATSSPGSITGSSASSPITVSGLSNGTAYTFTVTATNANGTSSASAASNSVTPVVPVTYWLQKYGAAGLTGNYLSVTADSSGNTYGFADGAVAGVSSQSNSPSFRYAYISTQTAIRKGIASNATYTAIVSNSAASNLSGFVALFNNSNGSVAWERSITSSAYTGAGAQTRLTGVQLDASNNVYVTGYTRQSSSTASIIPWLAKFNSSGTLQWNSNFNVSTSNGGGLVGIAVDSSGNVYCLCGRSSPSLVAGVIKVDSTGTFQWANNYWNTSVNFTPVYNQNGTQNIVCDSSGNVLFIVGVGLAPNSYQLCVVKLNSSGSVVWANATDVNGNQVLNPYAMTIDSDNNTYSAFIDSSAADNGYLKHNSSGTLLLQRTWSSGAAMYAQNMATDANALYAGLLPFGGTAGSNPYIFKVPKDGSKTGSYSIGGSTINYSATSYGTINPGTVSSRGNQGSFNMSVYTVFSVATASNTYTSYSTMFNSTAPTTVTI
jgi:hypothetical protein